MAEDRLTAENAARPSALHGYLVEFGTPGALVHAAEKVRDAGYQKWDVYSPFPIHGMDRAMGVRRTILPWLVLGGGICGGTLGLTLEWFANATATPGLITGFKYLISDKPFFSLPAFIPVVFELTVLGAAISAFLFMLILNNLPFWSHPLDANERFRRSTSDGFFLSVEARDPRFDPDGTRRFLECLGGKCVEDVKDGGDSDGEE